MPSQQCCKCRVPQQCPREIAELIDWCLKSEPCNRPTCEQILDILQRVEDEGEMNAVIQVLLGPHALTQALSGALRSSPN